MIPASAMRPGNVIRLDREFYKVVESVTHSGGGKMGAMVHAKLRNLSTGHVAERRLGTDEKVEDIPLNRVKMQFLYKEGDSFYFMNPDTYDQAPIPKSAIGPAVNFIRENDVLDVEFYEETPLSVVYAQTVELKVATTGVGLRGQSDSTLKEATLENGMQVLVPQFIKEGDRIRLDAETGKYLERVTDRQVKGAKFEVAALPTAAERPSQQGAASAAPPQREAPGAVPEAPPRPKGRSEKKP